MLIENQTLYVKVRPRCNINFTHKNNDDDDDNEEYDNFYGAIYTAHAVTRAP